MNNTFINVFFCGAILVHALCVINTITGKSDHLFRVSYILVAVGAASVLMAEIAAMQGYLINVPAETILNAGVAMVLIVGRWLRKGGSYDAFKLFFTNPALGVKHLWVTVVASFKKRTAR